MKILQSAMLAALWLCASHVAWAQGFGPFLISPLGVGSSSNTQVLYNNAGVVAGSSGLTYDGLGDLTASNDLISNNAGYIANGFQAGTVDSAIVFLGANNFDTPLYRDAAGILAQRSGTSAQDSRVYNSYTDALNNEYGGFSWQKVANTLQIGTWSNGTGVARNLEFVVGGVNVLDYGISVGSGWLATTQSFYVVGHIQALGNIAAGNYLIGTTGAELGSNFINSGGNGVLWLANNANAGFSRLAFGGTSAAYPSLNISSTILQAKLADNSAYSPFEAATLRTATAYTVATLPAGAAGMRAYVTDELTSCATPGAALTGGGLISCPVFYNGAAWVGD